MSTTPLSRPDIRFHVLFAAILFGTAFSTLALTGIAPVLTNATWSANQFQFTLRGETNVAYILESSSNLRNWTPSVTNSDSQTTRTITVPAVSSETFWRVRRVPSPLFPHAIVARGVVALNGSGRIDSFNSTNALESTLGQYDPAKATDRALVGTTLRTPGAMYVGTMEIYGSVATGPGGTVQIAPSGSVGSKAWVQSVMGKGLVEPGHLLNDVNHYIPPATLPHDFNPRALPQNVLYPEVGGTNYQYAILEDGDYRTDSISIGIGEKMIINAKARLHVLGSTTVSNSGCILLGPAASIEWYAEGQVSIGGLGCINGSGLARNFSVIGLSTNTILCGGQAGFIGTIYAPLARVWFNGIRDAIGAIVCTNFTLTGTMGLHFDESLKSAGPSY